MTDPDDAPVRGRPRRDGSRASAGPGRLRRIAARPWRLLALLLPTALLLPPPAGAQWVEAPGEGWVQLTVFHHDTREEFDREGDVEPFFADGHMVTTSAFLTGAVGLVPGLDAWVQVPVHRLRFDDAAGERTKTGVGDVRLWLRVGPGLVGLADALPVAVALRAGVKLPGSDFPVDAEVIPVTEGQRDYEAMVEVGRSFHPVPLYAKAWIGYRTRETNREILWDPGNETFAFAALGGRAGFLHWELAGEGLWGEPPVKEGLRLERAGRKILQLLPKVGVPAGPLVLELGGRLPLEGRNLPAGPALQAGVFSPVEVF